MSEKPYRFDTSLPMGLGILLVVNSHLEGFHPRPWLAGDGLLGNYIFFFLSGLRIASGQTRHSTFGHYLWLRLLRIYPAVWIVTVACVIMEGKALDGVAVIGDFLWPTNFTYITWILPFYLVLFFILRSGVTAMSSTVMAAIAFWLWAVWHDSSNPNTFSDIPTTIQVTGYFILFLAGAMTSLWQAKVLPIHWLLTSMLTASYILAKYLVVTNRAFDFYPAIFCLGACAAFVLCMSLGTRNPAQGIQKLSRLKGTLFLSSHSLEIYVTHSVLLGVTSLQLLPYPLNIVALLMVTFAASAALKWATDKVALRASR